MRLNFFFPKLFFVCQNKKFTILTQKSSPPPKKDVIGVFWTKKWQSGGGCHTVLADYVTIAKPPTDWRLVPSQRPDARFRQPPEWHKKSPVRSVTMIGGFYYDRVFFSQRIYCAFWQNKLKKIFFLICFFFKIFFSTHFFIFSQKLSTNFPNWQKKCDEKVTKFCSKQKNYPKKIHFMKCRNF